MADEPSISGTEGDIPTAGHRAGRDTRSDEVTFHSEPVEDLFIVAVLLAVLYGGFHASGVDPFVLRPVSLTLGTLAGVGLWWTADGHRFAPLDADADGPTMTAGSLLSSVVATLIATAAPTPFFTIVGSALLAYALAALAAQNRW
jgi:hypothetical protein